MKCEGTTDRDKEQNVHVDFNCVNVITATLSPFVPAQTCTCVVDLLQLFYPSVSVTHWHFICRKCSDNEFVATCQQTSPTPTVLHTLCTQLQSRGFYLFIYLFIFKPIYECIVHFTMWQQLQPVCLVNNNVAPKQHRTNHEELQTTT